MVKPHFGGSCRQASFLTIAQLINLVKQSLNSLLIIALGLCFVEFFAVTPLTLALATGLAVSLMLLTKTTHPPAGANPLLIMLTQQHWWFLFSTVLLGAIAMVLVAQAMQWLQRRLLRAV
ncbi:HPP family protein [Shewanella sp.]|uniref:HPP family protein n=1 Tax=Shewanella sp. TaxID=50422 RepID=UPI003A981861